MKRTLIVALALTASLFASQASAGLMSDTYFDDARSYLTLGGGATILQAAAISDPSGANRISTLPGFNGFIAAGLAWDVGRVELSASYSDLQFDTQSIGGVESPLDGTLQMFNVLASVFYDFNKDGFLSPYFGGGIGAARLGINSTDLAGNDAFTFAYQLGLGVTMNTGDSFAIDLGYRLVGTNSVNFGGGTTADYLLFHNANVGFRFLF